MKTEEIIELANADNAKCLELSKLAKSFRDTELYKEIFLSIMTTKGAGDAGVVGCKLLDIITILSEAKK